MLKRTKSGIGRRQAVKVMGAGAALIAVPEILVPRKARAAERLVIRNPGGPFEKAFDIALHKPFQQATGVEVVGVTSAHEPVAVIKGMVETKAYQWDATILSEYTHNTLAKGGFLEDLGFEKDTVVSEVPANLKAPTIVASYVWSTVLAYRTDVYPAKGRAPTGGWKDLWDVKGIPGRRGLRKYPVDTLENAVLADGVAADKVYPIDQDRAFKSLDKIKKDVAVWWSGGAQSSQLIKSGELDICVMWNGRAQTVIDEGGPVAISWNQSLWSYDGWAIPKGAPKAELARKFIRFATEPKNQAAFTPYVAYGPSHPGAMKVVDPARAKLLPTYAEYFPKSIKNNAEYWAGNQEAALDRFNKWMIS